ncbi:DUF1223 domain-containing protein [Chryseobacterium rhizosphaerae]|uniref:DUF1223 domain-containing protein n=1 Tax=Chryseobacterium rhizosphaerae TaxID=395937 RepID=A0ABX9IJY5_9FLAO|nr:DUF1223 domain-containing protein [Chryseobacterium rhizosphaerae]REC74016.1 DUF1223 domain-containing protein [Chryseobacterium rhizosphaerae]GEN67313.1 hypothetical protein CRH01_18810 [Chryseobacterium rhizosphaerae]
MILKNLITTGAFTSLLFAAFAFVQVDQTSENELHSASEDHGFAVLELFTSEGCSSCPPADDLMGQIEKKYKNEPVYILSYHVDYWNRLGWKDRFSTSENSQRQQQYSRILGSQVYTPQLIVNGKTEFVGSDHNAVESAIQKALFVSKNTKVELSARASQNEINVQYKTNSTDPKHTLVINLVEKQSSTQVAQGENEGRHLQHWQIVHKQNKIQGNAIQDGASTFLLPEHFSPDNWEIIAFIQNTKTGEILGSAKTDLK